MIGYMEPIDGDAELVLAYGNCYACGMLFSFHPVLVPSMPVGGIRQPICERCIARVNLERARRGLAPFEVLPGAYAPASVSELGGVGDE